MGLLARAAAFFRSAQFAGYGMDQMETRIRGADPTQLEALNRDLEETLREPLTTGMSLVAESKAGADGVAATMEHLRNRAESVRALLGMRQAHGGTSKAGEALRSFVSKLEELEAWRRTVTTFLEKNVRLNPPGPFLESHREFANRVHMKTFELEGLKGALEAVANQSPTGEAREVAGRMEETKRVFSDILDRITRRISAAEALEKFLRLCEQLERELTSMEQGLVAKTAAHRTSLEETRVLIQQLQSQLAVQGRRAKEAARRAGDELIDDGVVEEFTSRLSSRQASVAERWKGMDALAREGQRMEEEWGRIDREKRESMEVTLRVDAELFPIISQGDEASRRPAEVAHGLEERALMLPRQRMVAERFVQLISRTEELLAARKLPEDKEEEARRMVGDLRQKLKALQVHEIMIKISSVTVSNFFSSL